MVIEGANKKRNLLLWILLALVIVGLIFWLCFWVFYARFHVKTQDAYVHGNKVELTPQISGGIESIYAEETNLVEQGQLLIKIDPSNYILAVEQHKDQLGNTVRRVVGYFYDVESKQAELEYVAANLEQAKLDLRHREGLVQTGAIAVEEFEQFETNVIAEEAKLEMIDKQLQQAKARIANVTVTTHPEVLEATSLLKEAYLNFLRCNVLSPVTGYVAKRTGQTGDYVMAGTTLLEIVPLEQIWIEANLLEKKIRKVRIDQPVIYTADMHGDRVRYSGKVVGFQPGSGNAFALLPPENASGNWIKIAQRVPVRVSVDPRQIRKYPLFLGVSINANIDVHDTSGRMISNCPTEKLIYNTDLYRTQFRQMEEIQTDINAIIQSNL